ncbi:acetyl-CoA carboxylase family protein [Marinobacter salicampi]|uniref:acetyl-CoA carboxylase family protein n=1 Tax=Marinobacter salicampi TaxID=435907 RepID=UPI00140885CC|nr:carboxyl transferase domain-containing protein [Marinobacter salicampi]
MEKSVSDILIANRGEIAIRIARSLAEGGIRTVGVYARDDAASLHVRRVDKAVPLTGTGASAYLDGEQLIQVAHENGCQAIHPGYGFLSENAEFAEQCRSADLIFIGPSAECLALLGNKARARALAEECGVPLAEGTAHPVSPEEAIVFLEAMKARYGTGAGVMIKALAGGGGRGMRPVSDPAQVANAYRQSASEAGKAFGNESVYVERLISHARHIEVQVLGDAEGAVSHLWERDCSLQRRRQKLVELAPAPGLSPELRRDLIESSLRMAKASGLQGLATFEFLLDLDTGGFVFMEANPRLQVEHTVTEALTGVDLVTVQTALATGHALATLGLGGPAAEPPDRMAIQLRINLESLLPDGTAVPASGTIVTYEPPGGPGVRVDGAGYSGLEVSTEYDSLLAKLVVCGQSAFPAVVNKAYRTLCEFRLEGVPNNLPFLRNLLSLPEMQTYAVSTATVADNLDLLSQARTNEHPSRYFEAMPLPGPVTEQKTVYPEGGHPVRSPVQGRVARLFAAAGDTIQEGQLVALVEAMKMEFEVKASASGEVLEMLCSEGASVGQDCPILVIRPDRDAEINVESELEVDLDAIRQDLSEVRERHSRLYDDQRPEAVAKRRRTGQRTARENVDDLLDEGSFVEYGALALAARRRRHSEKELMAVSPADGLIAGLGTVNGGQYGAETARCMVLAYDYTVFAGTQGVMNHKKTDRMLQLAKRWSLPLVLFAEGGGGRPGDTDFTGVAGLDCHTFTAMAALSGQVPLVGIAAGRCFAGNAALLGCCDVIIATRNASIGMAGPAMIEGGGLGRFRAEEVGPVSVQAPNGVVDIVVEDEAEAVQAAKRYLSFAQGRKTGWEAPDQRLLRHLIPENRLRAYDMRQVIEALADEASVLELRRDFAQGMITCLARVEGHAFGLMANNPRHLGGAIDAEAGDKAARFMRLCDAMGLPILSLCDTPGFMVGPEAEKQATVRHVSRMFVTAARLQVPFFTVVLRKGYGLGAQAMAAGSFHSPMFTIGWPSSEFGAMGLEGAVKLGFAKELAAVEDEQERQALFEKMVSKAYEQGKGMNMASYLEIDAVIDPADTRRWLIRGVESIPERKPHQQAGSGVMHDLFIDTW